MNRLQEKYYREIRPALRKEFGLKNPSAVPTLEKIVINMGVGRFKDDKSYLEAAMADLERITGQRRTVRAARKSVAGFKLRTGEPVGLKVTLRRERMWGFFDKLVNIVLPRLRDFRGVKKNSFDGNGNYTLGLVEHTVFPEIDPNKVTKLRGLEVSIVTTTRDDKRAFRLLQDLGMPFEKVKSAKLKV